ncbi:MAG TPA: C25 family cysteine peptidase, partial [Verrucomicrobiae bacterium]|nr:C25 family cysteine peptidase [Verrucomicrobiae bacterium]
VSIHPSFDLTAADGWEAPTDPPLPRGKYPRRQAEVSWTGWLRDAHVAEIRFYPVRSAGGDGGILYAREILVRVDFVADAAARSPRRAPKNGTARESAAEESFHEIQRRALINADRFIPTPRPAVPAVPVEPAAIEGTSTLQSGTPAPLKISINADGLYRLTPADLTTAGINLAMVNPQNFRIENLGVAVPIEVLGEGDGTFDPADRIVFYGRAATGRYTRNNVYWLYFDGGSPRAAQRSGAFGSPATTPASFVTTVHAEQDLIYTQNIPPFAIDHWWWKLQSAGDPNSASLLYSVSLPNVDPTLHTVNVRVNVQGRTLASANPDHHTRIFLNGTQIDDRTWDGQISFTHSVSVSSGLVLNGSNTVRIDMVGDTGVAADQVYTNFIEVDYRKTYAATSNGLFADGEGSGSFRFSMTGFTTNDIFLYDATNPTGLTRITVPAGQITGAGPFMLGFQDSFASDRLYAAATTAGLRAPAGIVQDVPSSLKSASNGADFIAITPPEFVAALQPLLNLRASQGMRVLVATTDDIFDEFNFGVFDPAAIKSFLSYAYANYTSPAPQYVLLNGDAHIDYLDNLGSGVKQFVPATLILTSSIGEVPSDNQYVAVAGGDNLPEMFIGRLPVRSAADVTVIVNKILAYENNPSVAALNAQSLYIADNDESSFEAVLTSLSTLMPPTMAANNIFLSQLGTAAATKTAIINGMDSGALLTTYLGHGSATQWASECIWATGGVSPCNASDQNLLAAT